MQSKQHYLLLWVLVLPILGFAQIPKVSDLCYQEEDVQFITVPEDFNFDKLESFEKLKFGKEEYTRKYHKYIDQTENAVQDIIFISQKDRFPQWYQHPDVIRSNSEGMRSYFVTDSEYLPDGWVGSLISETQHGQYVQDDRTGERYLETPYSEIGLESYIEWNRDALSFGFLLDRVFKVPTADEILNFTLDGYTVLNTDELLTISGNDEVLKWDVTNQVFSKTIYEDNVLQQDIKKFYKLNETFGLPLLSGALTTTYKRFISGQNYQLIEVKVVSGYDTDCVTGKIASRSVETEAKELSLELYPNPVEENLTITIPNNELSSTIRITTITGETFLERKIDIGNTNTLLSLKGFPAGVYIVQVKQAHEIYSSKIVKQ
jgi:hypothetical protein